MKRTIWRSSENSSKLRLLGIFLKSHLLRTEDMPAKLSPVYETRSSIVRARSWLPYTIGVGHQVNPGGIHHLHTLFSSCEAELEELIVHESEQCRTRRLVLVLSPLQYQRARRCNNATFTPSGSVKPIPQQIKLCQRLVREGIRHHDHDPN